MSSKNLLTKVLSCGILFAGVVGMNDAFATNSFYIAPGWSPQQINQLLNQGAAKTTTNNLGKTIPKSTLINIPNQKANNLSLQNPIEMLKKNISSINDGFTTIWDDLSAANIIDEQYAVEEGKAGQFCRKIKQHAADIKKRTLDILQNINAAKAISMKNSNNQQNISTTVSSLLSSVQDDSPTPIVAIFNECISLLECIGLANNIIQSNNMTQGIGDPQSKVQLINKDQIATTYDVICTLINGCALCKEADMSPQLFVKLIMQDPNMAEHISSAQNWLCRAISYCAIIGQNDIIKLITEATSITRTRLQSIFYIFDSIQAAGNQNNEENEGDLNDNNELDENNEEGNDDMG